jgi:peptidyl-prolyl cis-trans isomerase A (cyclophilin A)
MSHKQKSFAKAVWIYLFAFLLLAINFHAEATSSGSAGRSMSKANLKVQEKKESQNSKGSETKEKKGKIMFANIETTAGKIRIKLHGDKTPITVDNFVGLAEGTKEFTDPKTGKKEKRPYFDGVIFHRVVPGFVIQGGDPTGTGTGGPGYKFKNEPHPELKHDKPGIVAMANAGRDTNGSQFYITLAPLPSLDGGYTVFGEVVEGQKVVEAIANAPRSGERPLDPAKIVKISIEK